MPRLLSRPLVEVDGLTLRRVVCDGVDERGSADEFSEEPRIILVMHGRFAFEDSRTRAVASPAMGLVLPAGATYRIRHLDGGDECIGVGGSLCEALLEHGPTARRVSAADYVRLQGLAVTLGSGVGVPRLAVEEALSWALGPVEAARPNSRRSDHDIAEAIAYTLERGVGHRVPLAEATAGTGVSLFHACRVFKCVTGSTIHGHQQEIRLRHALALVLDTDRPIAQVAVDAGFANQGHLTNLFRRRFGTTPARARRVGLPRLQRPAPADA